MRSGTVECLVILRRADGSTARKWLTTGAAPRPPRPLCCFNFCDQMIVIANNEEAAQARYALAQAVLIRAEWQLLLGEEALTTLARDGFEFSVEWGKLIFAWWDDEQAQSWRVTAYEIDEAELRLQATRGLGRATLLLTLRDLERWRAQRPAELSSAERRARYAELLARLIARRVDKVQRAGERTHYARLRLRLDGETALAIGMNEAEAQTDVDGVLAAGLVWLNNFNATRAVKQQARRLWFCLPQGKTQTTLERLTLMSAAHLGARIECFEVAEQRAAMIPVQPAAQGELLNAHPRQVSWPSGAATSERWRARILALAPDLIEARQCPPHAGESFSINGLEFARVMNGEPPRVQFGIAGLRTEAALGREEKLATLSEANFGALEQLVREIVKHRAADAPARLHPFYRLRAEAWLESLLRRDIRALDATLDARFVYSQLPTWRGEDRSVIDLLTINKQGRLVVIEIKAGEDAQLPLQGLDYWLRVAQARLRGELTRRELFAGVELADQAPLLYLVAPRLRFHRTFAVVARCLVSEIEAYRIGLNTDWRAGVRVHTCERVNQC